MFIAQLRLPICSNIYGSTYLLLCVRVSPWLYVECKKKMARIGEPSF